MNQSILFKAPIFVLFITVLSGCIKGSSSNNDCYVSLAANTISVTGATTAAVNQEISLTVTWGAQNECGVLERFNESTAGNTTTITVLAGYQGCYCQPNAPIRTSVYKFKRAAAGTYTLQFLQTGNTYLTYTIVVS